MPSSRKLAGLAGILAIGCFVGGWVSSGVLTSGYSPVRQPISQLARIGAPYRPLMTAAFLSYALLLPGLAGGAARVLRTRWVGWSILATAFATAGVAAFPLSATGGHWQDRVHAGWATAGYLSLAATPLLASRRMSRLPRVASLLTGVASAVCLALTPVLSDVGLLQRAGLTIVDCWLLVVAALLLAGRGVDGTSGQVRQRPGDR